MVCIWDFSLALSLNITYYRLPDAEDTSSGVIKVEQCYSRKYKNHIFSQVKGALLIEKRSKANLKRDAKMQVIVSHSLTNHCHFEPLPSTY